MSLHAPILPQMDAPAAMELVDGLADDDDDAGVPLLAPQLKAEPGNDNDDEGDDADANEPGALQEMEEEEKAPTRRVKPEPVQTNGAAELGEDEEEYAAQAAAGGDAMGDNDDDAAAGALEEDNGAAAADDADAGDAGRTDAPSARDQERLKSKKIQTAFRKIQDSFRREETKAALSNPNSDAFGNYMRTIDKQHRRISDRDMPSAVVDADVHACMAEFGVAQVKQLTHVQQRSAEEVVALFVKRWAEGSGDDGDDAAMISAGIEPSGAAGGINTRWASFGRSVAHHFATVTPTSFMKGVLGLQSKSKGAAAAKKRSRRAAHDDDDDLEPVARAQQLQQADMEAEASTMSDRRVADLLVALPATPTCLFTVLFHPASFTQTVENLFDLTFLVRKGQAGVAVDDELGIPVVWRVDADEEIEDDELGRPGEAKNFQCIMTLDTTTYKSIVSSFGLDRRSKPWLPDRTNQYKEDARAEIARAKKGAAAGAAAAAGSASAAAAAASGSAWAASRTSGSKRSRATAAANFFSPTQPTLDFGGGGGGSGADDDDDDGGASAAAAPPSSKRRRAPATAPAGSDADEAAANLYDEAAEAAAQAAAHETDEEHAQHAAAAAAPSRSSSRGSPARARGTR